MGPFAALEDDILLTRRLLAAAGLVLLFLALGACRREEQLPSLVATPTPGAVRTVAGTTVPAAPTTPPTPRLTATSTPVPATATPVPPTATPTPDATREAEARIVTLDYPLRADPQSLDPVAILPTDQPALDVAGVLFARLTRFDAASGEPRAWLAREWSLDGTKAVFRLRDDVPWVRYNAESRQVEPVRDPQGNPRRVQAADVVYAVRRALDPKSGADSAGLLYIIQGAQEYNTRAGTPAERVGVRAVDAWTVEFTLTRPAAYLPAIAALTMVAPQPQWAVEAGDGQWTTPATIVTSGPYALAEWQPGKVVTLVRNPAYPDRDRVAIERLRFPIVADPGQAYTLFVNGNLDSVLVPDGERTAAQAQTAQGRKLHAAPTGCTTFVGFTLDRLPMDRVAIRRALSAAIDRQALVDRVVKAGIPATALTPTGVFGALGESGQGYDAEGARRLMAEAGFPEGRNFPPLSYAYNTCESPTCKANALVAEALRDMWQATLGIQVKLESMEWPAYLQRINRRTPVEQMPHAWRMAWCEDFPDQHNWLYEAFHVNAPGSFSRTRPGRFDELVAQASGTADPARRAELYREAERLLVVDEARIAPLYTAAEIFATQPWLRRDFLIQGGQNFDEWQLDWAAKRRALGK